MRETRRTAAWRLSAMAVVCQFLACPAVAEEGPGAKIGALVDAFKKAFGFFLEARE